MECKVVSINKKEIRYHKWYTKEQCPTILCLHGLGSTSLSFIEIADILSNEYNIISVDLPGHGKSDTFEVINDYTMDNLVKWLDSLVLKLNLKEFIIVAHSFGADIAIHYARRFTKKVLKLILLDGGYYNKRLQYKIVKEQMDAGLWEGLGIITLEAECDYYERDFNNYYFSSYDEYIEAECSNYKRLSDRLIIALKDLMTKCKEGIRFVTSGNVARGAIQAMYYDPSSILLKEIKIPMLLLISTEPNLWYNLRCNLLDNINSNDSLTILEVKNTSHFLHYDRPEYICEIINNYL